MLKKTRSRSDTGFSMIELLIVLVVIGIVVTFAVTTFGDAASNFDRQNIAREFKVSLERARFDSVKRRATECSDMSGVTIDNSLFTVMIDLDRDGTLGARDVREVNLANRGDVNIVPNGLTLPFTVRFDARGRAFINDCDPSSTPTADVPLLFFCDGPCTTATANAENSNVVFVSAAGTVAMLYGGETMPTFADAEVTEVPADQNVSRQLAVWDPDTVIPTPTASATTSPVTTPSSTPTPDPSATPVPQCPLSPPWGRPPACECTGAGQWVRDNGQCK